MLSAAVGSADTTDGQPAGPALPGGQADGDIPGGPGSVTGSSPWAWDVTGGLLASLAWQAALYGSAVLLLEAGVLPRMWRHARAAWVAAGAGAHGDAGYASLPGQAQGEEQAAAERGEAAAEDDDVAAERRMLQVTAAAWGDEATGRMRRPPFCLLTLLAAAAMRLPCQGEGMPRPSYLAALGPAHATWPFGLAEDSTRFTCCRAGRPSRVAGAAAGRQQGIRTAGWQRPRRGRGARPGWQL